jgi:hypothetical protein
MLYKLSQGQKHFVDFSLSILGIVAGIAVVVGDKLPSPWNIAVIAGGASGGYLVSNLTTYIETGQKPSIATVAKEAEDIFSIVRPAVVNQISALPPEQQGVAQGVLDTIDLEIAKQKAAKA